jgi:hypothetical protein
MGWRVPERLIRLARALDRGVSEIFLRDFGDLFIVFRLDDMGINTLKIRVNLSFSRG